MPNQFHPTVGQWYQHRDKGELFEVIAADDIAGTVEIQDFDGDIEELDLEAWRDMEIELAAPPEDWTGPYDDVETDDPGYTETGMTGRDWRMSLESSQTKEESWQDPRPADERGEEERPAVR